MISIRHQDPEASDSAFLLAELLAASKTATAGAAFFAFASRDGVRAFLGATDFRAFLGRSSFDLVIGVDAITDQRALDELKAMTGLFPRLTARAFLHDRARYFHPKVCWFKTRTGGIVFVGSGNLTVGGLAENWEAFGELWLDNAQTNALAADWLRWTARHSSQLRDLDDAEVRARVARNLAKRPAAPAGTPAPAPAPAPRPVPGAVGAVPMAVDGTVLLAEIPGGDRWKQANFDIRTFREFFGANPSASRLLILWRLRDDGSVDEPEVRPTVTVKSRNFRIELEAAAGLTYPTGTDRPIGAFRKVSMSQFRYILVMPGAPAYAKALALLTSGAAPRKTTDMRRSQFTPSAVEAAWPECPLLVPLEDDESAAS